MFSVNRNPSVADLHKFGWAMLFGLGVIGLVFWFAPWIRERDAASIAWAGSAKQWMSIILAALGAALWCLSFARPALAKPVYIAWMSAAVPLGIVTTTIMLSVLYFLLLPVFSIVVRFGDPLRRKLHRDKTYWEDYKPYEPTLERMKRPF